MFPSSTLAAVDQLPSEELVDLVLRAAADQAAHHAHWLSLLAEVDRRELWGADGAVSLAHWLGLKTGMDGRTAREHVQVMQALEALPRVRATYAEGRISYSKVRALCRVATPASEEFLLDLALQLSAAALERSLTAFVAATQPPISIEDDTARRERCGINRWVDDLGLVHHEVISAPEDGLLLDKAIDFGIDEVHRERRAAAAASGASERPRRVRGPKGRLEGLLWAARNGMANMARGLVVEDPYLITFHVREGEAFFTDDGRIDTGSGLQLHPRTLQRLCCSSMIQAMLYGDTGERPLDLGRRARLPNRKQRLAMRAQHRTCRFPLGCDVPSQYCTPHHVAWWGRDHGPTDLDNLVPLCREHHWVVHEGKWNLVFGPDRNLVLIGPDGRAHDGAPPPVVATDASAVRRRLRALGIEPDGRELGGTTAGERLTWFGRSVIVDGIWQEVLGTSPYDGAKVDGAPIDRGPPSLN